MKKPNLQDLTVYVALIGLGLLGVVLSCRARDFVGDAYYFELARSIAQGRGYVFDFRPQTMVPPGFPYLLALMTMVIGSKYVVLVRSMAVFFTLALIATYEVLRLEEGRWVAGATCLLLGSSPELFQFSTHLVFSDMPYFFTSMILLWLMIRIDSAEGGIRKRTIWWLLSGALMVVSVLMRSTGIALVGGILGWIMISAFREREAVKRRIRIFLPLAAVGLLVQGAWMYWAAKHQFAEWPIHGYQENYLAQLKLKSGNDPELGMATWRDAVSRPVYNADDRAAALVGLLTRKQMAPAWYSPGTLIPLGLLLLGLGYSFWRNGGDLLEWYFVSYEGMFLFWPWDFELRFILPVVPLACLYMWRGGALLWGLAREKTRRLGLSLLGVAAYGFLGSIAWGRHVEYPSMRSCVTLWGLVGLAAIGLCHGGPNLVQRLSHWLNRTVSVPGKSLPLRQALGTGVLAVLVALGVAMQVKIGLANYHFDLKADGTYPDIEAAEWIRSHSGQTAVVMARKEDLVFHYGQRKVVWFPPSSDPKILMEGIRKYHVRYVVVDEEDTYWRPGAWECFKELSRAYPGEFQLVHQGPHNRVFFVEGTDQNLPNS